MSTGNPNIKSFINHFRNKIIAIDQLQVETEHDTLKLLLYTAIIDTLSKTASPPFFNEAEKFANIIEYFSDWPHCNKISIIHLIRYLDIMSHPKLESIKKTSFAIIDTWDESKSYFLDKDPDLNLINNKLDKTISKKQIGNISINHLQHKYLFYKFRCCLMHELRPPGYGRCYPEDEEPCYRYSSISDSFSLCYPVLFCKKICENILNNLEKYYSNNRINPRDYFKYGPYWIELFNT